MRKRNSVLGCVAALLVGACGQSEGPTPTDSESGKANAKPAVAAVDSKRLLAANEEPGEWMAPGRTYDEQRYSPLKQIDATNVSQLGLAWYFDFNTHRGVESSPLFIDGVMYAISAWNITYAIDARTGKQLWRFDPQVDRTRARFACCDVVNRGISAWKGRIYLTTVDGRLIALNAADGTPVWTQQTFDNAWPYTSTGATRVFDGKVVIGNAGAEYGVRGYVTAYDADTGKQLWRFYTVPGDPKLGFESKAMEMAAKTWTGEWWKQGGGGTAWDSIVYDPALKLVYIGTGNGSPHAQAYRSPGGGDNLFLASIVAVNAETGEYVWHYQVAPEDSWDFTATMPMVLADLQIEGRARKVLMQAPKNGFFYVIDRETGELISAEKFTPVNLWATHVDLKTGRPAVTKVARYGTKPVLLTPSVAGAHSWPPMAFNPNTGLVYFPAQEHWWVFSLDPDYKSPEEAGARRVSTGTGGRMTPERAALMKTADSRERGWLTAWDPVKQKEAWHVPQERAGNGGVLTTAGNLVFAGTAAKTFVAYRADNGEKLWEQPVQTVPMAGPITYTLDGEQYIAVNAGWGGGMAMAELRGGRGMQRSDARLLVFKLGGKAQLPPLPDRPAIPFPPPSTAPADVIAKGGDLYAKTCANCHGPQAVGGGVIRDLRHMTPQTRKSFKDIVLKGQLVGLGMASFANVLSEADADAIHAYLIQRANADWEQ
jgi:quinohemoprotein ethanol dehydrogenase